MKTQTYGAPAVKGLKQTGQYNSQETPTPCWLNVGPALQTMDKHWANIVLTGRVTKSISYFKTSSKVK